MTIYLYVKTHNKTGLKYLGKTESTDPHKYSGSGTYWKLHLKKHGKDYNTEILKECQTREEFAYWGLYYSNLWNVVESNDWANLKEETGDARGKLSKESRGKISKAGLGREPWNKGLVGFQAGEDHYNYGRKRSAAECAAISAGRKGKGAGHHRLHSSETKQKIKEARSLQIMSEDTKQKIGNSNRGKAKPVIKCPYCNKEGGVPQMKQWHFDNCKLK